MRCPEQGELTEAAVHLLLTQYRESTNLIDLIRSVLDQSEEAARYACDIPEHFNLFTAVGEQLTFIGKRMGWPRCHCVCAVQPVFGFDCDEEGFPSDYTILGFCRDEATWIDCGEAGTATICLNDDEMYRRFLLARRFQMLALFDRVSLTVALRHMWGPTAVVLDEGNGRVVLAPGRALDAEEIAVLQLVPRVMPVAPGIRQRFHFDRLEVFGFGPGWGGFCEAPARGWEPRPEQAESFMLVDGDGNYITAGSNQRLTVGSTQVDALWMCEIDVYPYDCPPEFAVIH